MPFLDQLPRGIAAAKKCLGYQCDDFVKYAVCPSCHTIYNIDDCKRMLPNNTVLSATCDYVMFPNHPQKSRRKKCGTLLKKSVKTSSGSVFLYPSLIFCYRSIFHSLQKLLIKPGFF